VLDYSINPSGKWPWSMSAASTKNSTAASNYTSNSTTTSAPTNSSTPILSGWHYYPNYQDIRGTEQVGTTMWLATYGGLLKFDTETKEHSWFTVKDGLSSNLLTSIAYDPATKYLWLGHQNTSLGSKGGVTKFDTTTNKIVQFYSNPADDTDIFRQYFPATYDGLISGSNVQLKRDPYSGDIWAATFRGISRYVADGNTWESYGTGATIDFAGVRDIGFTPTSIWIYVTPNAYTKGGMLRLTRATKQWAAQNETSKLKLDRDDINFTTRNGDVWAAGRPNDWVSVEKSRDTDVYRYLATTDSWQKITEVNATLLATDHVTAMKTINDQIVLSVLRKNGSSVEMIINPTTLAVTTQTVAPTFVEQYGSDMGYPSVSNVVYTNSSGGLMTSSGTLFNTSTGQQDTDVMQAIQAYVQKEPSTSGIQPIPCNQWNDSAQDILLEKNNEMMGGSYGLYMYRRSTKTIDLAVSADVWNKAVLGSNILSCNDNTVVMIDKTGASEFDIKTKTTKAMGSGFVDLQNFLGSNNQQAYFTATNNRLGIYDIPSEKFTYVDFQLPKGLSANALQYYTVTDRGIWFTSALSGDSSAQVNTAYVFNPKAGTWTTYSLSQQFVTGEQVNTIRAVQDEVWLISNLNIYILRPNGNEFTLADKSLRTGMMDVNVGMTYSTPNGVWFTNSFGLWGKVN
jgi:hypothetical protein